MFKLGYAAHHEQYTPAQLLEYAVFAEQAGFDTIWTADHFHPWVHTKGQCGFAWVWIAAGAERTKRIKIGTGVTSFHTNVNIPACEQLQTRVELLGDSDSSPEFRNLILF